MNDYQDYYKTLGVEKKASQEDIQRAYRKLARKFHPDINKESSAEEKFKQINEAYKVLGDSEKRVKYDQFGSGWDGQFTNQGHHGGDNVSYHFSNADMGQFSDFFQNLFGGGGWSESETRGGGVRRRRGRDHETAINITLTDAYHGTKKSIELEQTVQGSDGRPTRTRRSYEVTIPQGVTDGSLIRLAGQGENGSGGDAGDLFLRVNILRDSRFTLNGHDLSTTVDITPWEAALGAKVLVPTVDARISLTVPAGTQSGQSLRVRGKGMPISRGQFGDLIVTTRIVVPSNLTKRERELFEELTVESRFNPRQ
ncbi:MAG: J domain-containing protein [Desulfuromonadaceae bacterium]|nr:J domain-containing protein [Desulfuromonadaceae bacterium]MDD5104949.1 J domain-containing protein [Desulfuromonadaceae bacterium]